MPLFDERRVHQTIDWNTTDIDWQGRGWDRGLRGIAFDDEKIYIAASDELFVYTSEFEQIGSEGVRICAELLEEFTEIPGVSGANIMTLGSVETIPAAISASGLRAVAK